MKHLQISTVNSKREVWKISERHVKLQGSTLSVERPGCILSLLLGSRTGTSFHMLSVSPQSSMPVWGTWHLERASRVLAAPWSSSSEPLENQQNNSCTLAWGPELNYAWFLRESSFPKVNSIFNSSLKAMQKQHSRTWDHECHMQWLQFVGHRSILWT